MEITAAQYDRIADCFPVQRGNVSLSNLQVLNAILYVAEHGCKWPGLPRRFGNWHTIYTRMNRWSKAGVLDRVFERLQEAQIVRVKIEAVSLDSTIVEVHPDGTGALKETGPQAIGRSRGGWTTKIHMVAADARTVLIFCLSPGQAQDAPVGRSLLERLGRPDSQTSLTMDRAYEGDETGRLALDLGFHPLSLHGKLASIPGLTIEDSTKGATRSNGSFAASRDSDASSRDSRNSTSWTLRSSASHWSSMRCVSVNWS